MSFFSLRVRPSFRVLGVIATCFWLTLIIAYVADKSTQPKRRSFHDVPDLVVKEVEPEKPAPPRTAEEIARDLDYELYRGGHFHNRMRILMRYGDGSLLCDFRTEFMEDFKAFFDGRVSKAAKDAPTSELVVSCVLKSLKERLMKDGVERSQLDDHLPADQSKTPPAYAFYLQSLKASPEEGVKLMDKILALPAAERLPLNAIAKYRRARLRMDYQNWSSMTDEEVKASLRAIREDLTSVAEHAREGSLDPAEISDNADYWVAYSRSMILPSQRLVRLGEADYAGAISTYLRMPRRDQANAVNSCLRLAKKLCVDGNFDALVSEPDVRLIVTLFLCAGGGSSYEDMLADDLTKQRRVEWLDALRKANIGADFAPAHIALLQYQCGRWQECRRSSELLPDGHPLRRLLLARCQLRTDGDVVASARHLDPLHAAKSGLVANQAATTPVATEYALTALVSVQDEKELEERVQGELGLHALAEGDFLGALKHFEAGRHGIEALYVAECLLTVDELMGYVDARRKKHQAPIKLEGHWAEPFDDLEQELASRLMRDDRPEEALPYLPSAVRPMATHYLLMLRGAQRTDLSDRSRADSYWRCALAIRELGETLLHAPYGQSWSIGTGWHVGYGYFPRMRLKQTLDDQPAPNDDLIGAGAEERRRLTEWQTTHIDHPDLSERDARYAAFKHAMQAARLLPPNDPAGGQILQYAGNLLKYREPEAAQPAYRLLITRFPLTPYGAYALKSHWFSKERPAPPADIIGN